MSFTPTSSGLTALKVFVVSGDAAIYDSVKELVEAANLQAETFPSLDAFQDALAPGSRGCLLLDMQIDDWCDQQGQPGMVAAGATMPVLILIDRGDVVTAVRALQCGVVDVIEKPFRHASLLDSILQALERQ